MNNWLIIVYLLEATPTFMFLLTFIKYLKFMYLILDAVQENLWIQYEKLILIKFWLEIFYQILTNKKNNPDWKSKFWV